MVTAGVSPIPYDFMPPVGSFTLTSGAVSTNEVVPAAFRFDGMGVGGENRSPDLTWSGFPAETKSFAVTCYDPDAPTGSGFWHWLVINLPADVTSLPAGAGADDASLPAGAVHRRNDLGMYGYAGAAPPPGDAPHRYIFAVHALSVESLDVPAEGSAAFVGFNLTFVTLARALLIPVFGR
jgi:Raf kinase inhibitor-like YbhB/YbcL family protein